MKVAIVLLAGRRAGRNGTDGERLRRGARGAGGGDETRIIFDAAGTTWIRELSDAEPKYHRLLQKVRGSVSGACLYCARAYGVVDDVERAGILLVDEYRAHPSIRGLLADDFHVVTF